MEMIPIIDATQFVGNYAHQLESKFDELSSEGWNGSHKNAMQIFDVEELLTVMNAFIAGVFSAVEKRQRAIAEQKVPSDLGQTASGISWLTELAGALCCLDAALRRVENVGYTIYGAQAIHDNCDRAKNLLVELEKAIRIVRVEPDGRLFGASGEPVNVPGLDATVVARGLAELQAGRTRSLKDIIASRH